MAQLLDYNDYYFLKKESIINSEELMFYSHEVPVLRFVVSKAFSKKILFSVNPMIDALSFNPEVIVKNSGVFELKVNASLLPDNWQGDLLVNDDGMISRVSLNFSKKELK
ncbi:MAG: hypothetical protein PHG04_01445 [Candidatus Nanoarchaeia archaeon]|nr:hypothetical protein [Candidatus Nanoarchaeia archaeon]MDD5054027.1 hypothetical protein [Candidatus Nanoarchaeia archaeon]